MDYEKLKSMAQAVIEMGNELLAMCGGEDPEEEMPEEMPEEEAMPSPSKPSGGSDKNKVAIALIRKGMNK